MGSIFDHKNGFDEWSVYLFTIYLFKIFDNSFGHFLLNLNSYLTFHICYSCIIRAYLNAQSIKLRRGF